MKTKIGIICASDKELAPFLPWIEHCNTHQKAMLQFYEGTINQVEVVALYCGVCKVNAALAAQILIDTFHCTCLLNSGAAGGIDPSMKILDSVIVSESCYWDVKEDILTDFHPWMETCYFASDNLLLQRAQKVAQSKEHVVFGRVVTGESFIDQTYRQEIKTQFNPLAVDMETASIAHVCYVNRIPFLAIRTISDTQEQSGSKHYEDNNKTVSQIAAQLTREIIQEIYSHEVEDEK